MQRLGGDGKVGLPLDHGFTDLGRGTLVHVQRHLGEALDETLDHIGQRITSLGMGGRNMQRALLGMSMLARHRFDALHLAQDLVGNLDHVPPCRGDLGQMLAASLENLDPQLIFQHAHLLADPWLRGVEARCRCRHVQSVIGNLNDITQLLEFHDVRL